MTDNIEVTKVSEKNNRESLDNLIPIIYDELRKLAGVIFRSERINHTLQPTALVHEVYLKLIDSKNLSWQNKAHFLGIAAHAMRQILVNYAIAHNRQRRGGGQTLMTLDESLNFLANQNLDVIDLNEALERLSQLDERQARIVELRFFGGLSLNEIAAVLEISTATVSREWEMARNWLYLQLNH